MIYNNKRDNHLVTYKEKNLLYARKRLTHSLTVKPHTSYDNALTSKFKALKENKGKAGVYMWINLINNKSYIGSSVFLSRRLNVYYSFSSLKYRLNMGSSRIYSALLKYGYSEFRLDILEYCEPNVLLKREQYYIDLVEPEYNICKKAGSTLGFKHTEVTKEKLRKDKVGVKHGISFSENLSKAKRGKKHNKYEKINTNAVPRVFSAETRLKLSERSVGVSVQVFDKFNNIINNFPSMKSAAKHLGVDKSTISRIYKTGLSYDNYIYKFKVKDTRVWTYDSNYKLIKVFKTFKAACIWYNIPSTTMYRYIKSGKLYNKIYLFVQANKKEKLPLVGLGICSILCVSTWKFDSSLLRLYAL